MADQSFLDDGEPMEEDTASFVRVCDDGSETSKQHSEVNGDSEHHRQTREERLRPVLRKNVAVATTGSSDWRSGLIIERFFGGSTQWR